MRATVPSVWAWQEALTVVIGEQARHFVTGVDGNARQTSENLRVGED